MRSCDTDESSSRVREDLHLIAQSKHTGIPPAGAFRVIYTRCGGSTSCLYDR